MSFAKPILAHSNTAGSRHLQARFIYFPNCTSSGESVFWNGGAARIFQENTLREKLSVDKFYFREEIFFEEGKKNFGGVFPTQAKERLEWATDYFLSRGVGVSA